MTYDFLSLHPFVFFVNLSQFTNFTINYTPRRKNMFQCVASFNYLASSNNNITIIISHFKNDLKFITDPQYTIKILLPNLRLLLKVIFILLAPCRNISLNIVLFALVGTQQRILLAFTSKRLNSLGLSGGFFRRALIIFLNGDY